SFLILFQLARCPPGAPLFPYTTLFRSGVGLAVVVELDDLGRLEVGRCDLGESHHQDGADGEVRRDQAVGTVLGEQLTQLGEVLRSEEHTSELQSLAYLVCRLLLEKKKT